MILFDTNEKNFITNGLGRLTDAIACTVTEERNGSFELALTYPITGRKYKELILGRVILAKHSDGADLQPFRIYKITKPLNGKVEVYAEHISYQLSKIPVMPFMANSVTAALDGLVANAAETCPFSVWTDKTTKANFKVEYPASFRSLLGGVQGSILDVYGGGEYEWDMWTVKLHGNRGKDSGVEIRYGKNLTELEATSDTSGVYTGVCPFWRGEDGDVVTLPEKVIHATTQFSYSLTIPLDLSGEFENKPTEAQLRVKAQSYLNSNNGWELKENIKISFVALWQTKEYKSVAPLQRLNLCDTATVIHDKLGVRCKAKVVKTVYNCLLNRYDEIELGEARTNLTDMVRESVAKRIKDEVPSKTYLREAIDRATRLIAGGLGGHLVIGTNANGEPNELLIMDTDDKNTAVNCIRINANGIGFSTTGYNGTYRTAWTLDGHFVADFIDSGILSANVIKTGLLKDRTGKNFWNLETGEFQMSSETITVDGKEVATLDDINEAQRIAQSAIKSVRVEYSYSSSPTTAPTKNWSTKAPEWQNGRYIWQRTVTTTSNDELISDPVCISGAKGDTGERGLQGIQGEKGDQGIQGATGARGATGKSTYFHIAYAKSADGVTGFSTSDPTDRDYIGTYVDNIATDSTDPSKYAWQLVKGAQGEQGEKGIAGKNGVDGKTSYLHIAYATSSDGKTGFSTTASTGKTYIGQYVDFTANDSTDPTKYSWTLIKGEKGDRGLQGLQGEKGDQGIQGAKGATGKSSYFHIAYAKSADGKTGFSVSDPTDRDYIGTYVDNTATDSTDPSKYAWQLVKGAQGEKGEKGIAGKNGTDGKTSYLHIAYATSADGKTGFSTTVSTGKTYIGQYVDFTAADSTDYTKYSWTLIKGEKGDRGLQGIQGEKGDQGIQGVKGDKGAAGVSTYFHIAYAKSADGKTGFSVSDPTDRDYIGTYVDSTKTDSTDPTKYAWQLVKGAQGVQGEKGIAGKNGADGKTSYLHIAYATSADGKTGFSTTVSTGKTYIGQYVDFTANDSTDPTKYSWTLIKGEKGERGLQGIQGEKGDQGIQGAKGATGAAGVSSYFHIAYAKSADGKTGFSVSDPTGRDHIGTYVDTTKTDSTDPTKYAWQLVKGAQGIQGEKGIAGKNGADGKTSYLHIAYANSADGKTGFSTTDSTDKTYIGQYVDFTETDSTDYKKYTWSLIKGADGVSIVAVQNVYMISNNASGEVSNKAFNYLSDINAPTLAKVNGVADRYFSDKANEASCTTEWVKLTNPPDGLEYGARFTITEAKGKMRSVCWYGSNRAVPLVDGKTYTLSFYARVTSGKVRIHFRSGISAYPVYKTEDITASAWTRYSCTFKYNAAANKDLNGLGARIYLGVTSTYIGTCEMCGFQLEEGSTVSALLPETPGWNALMAAPSATNRYLWQYEVITYSDGTSTETTPGIIGAYSADGRGVKSVMEYYALNNSTTAPADSEFTTAVKATTTSNKYLWNYEVMELTDGTKLTSKKHIISTHGATGATGNGIKSVAITYATSTSNTTAPSSGWNSSVPSVAQGSYLWTRTVTTMTDGTSSTSYSVARQGEKGDTGATGAAGVGVKSTAVTYQAGSSGTTIPTGTWVTSIPTVNQGQFLWTRTVITYTDSKTSTAYSVSRNGKDGTSVTSIDVEYAQSTSSSIAPTSGWQTSAPAWVNGKYIWQRTVTKYSSGTTDTSKAVCITGEKGATGAKGDKGDTGAKGATGATGAKGDKGDTGAKGATGAKGDTGIGVKAITEQYYLSNSKTAQSGGSWVATAPAYKKDWFYWTRSKIDWTDGTTTYTAAVLASGVNSANEKVANMEVGGRNLILNSDFNKTTSGGIVTVSGDEIIFDSSAVGSTVSPYTVTLSLSAFAKTNLRGKKIIMSMDYKVDRAIAFGDTNPWVGAQLTLSRDTNTGGSTQSLNLLGNKTIPTAVTGKWVRVTATYDVTDYDLTGAVIKFWFRDAKGKVRFRHPKVEIGNVATDWTPAPEDAKSYTDAQIVITKADIKKTTDSISLEVSKKVGANEIISKINQTAESVTIKADKINFNGMITANKTFKIDTSGYMQATGGKVGGWKITSNSLENTETATYVKLNSGSFTAGTWSGQNIFAIGTKGSDGKVEVRWGVNQYGDMYAQTVKTEGLTVNMGGTISGTMNFKGLVMLSAGVQLTNSDKTNISVPSNKVNIVHGGKSYTLINFIKGVANGSIT